MENKCKPEVGDVWFVSGHTRNSTVEKLYISYVGEKIVSFKPHRNSSATPTNARIANVDFIEKFGE